jgi:uncharacterized membrane protein YdbT with pleckstrin-like domain
MAIRLREGEVIRIEAKIHWSAYLFPSSSALIGVLIAGLCIYGFLMNNQHSGLQQFLMIFPFFLIALTPFLARLVQNKFRRCIVTNERIYIEEGLISKVTSDIPLNKINDVSLIQSIPQRLAGSGDIAIMTGNDSTVRFINIAHPEEFRDAISEMMAKS